MGKSLIISKFINKELPKDHESTIEDRYSTMELLQGINTTIEILDTAGEEEYQNLIDMWINYAEGFALVFAIDNKESFNAIKKKYDRIIKLKGYSCPLILIGNKKDQEKNRQVQYNEAKDQALIFNCEYLEISALNDDNCKDPFIKLAHLIVQENNKKKISLPTHKPLPSNEIRTGGLCPSLHNLPCIIY